MSDLLLEDTRLRATEAQIDRALGLHMRAVPVPATPTASESHPQRRRFVQDGEVSVSVIHRDQGRASDINALEVAGRGIPQPTPDVCPRASAAFAKEPANPHLTHWTVPLPRRSHPRDR